MIQSIQKMKVRMAAAMNDCLFQYIEVPALFEMLLIKQLRC